MSSRTAFQLVHIGVILVIIAFVSAALAGPSNTIAYTQPHVDYWFEHDAGRSIFSELDPAQGAVVGDSYLFSAMIAGDSIRSVTFVVEFPDGVTRQGFAASRVDREHWRVNIRGFGQGDWRWWVVVKDDNWINDNMAMSEVVSFTVGRDDIGRVKPQIRDVPSTQYTPTVHWNLLAWFRCTERRKPNTEFCIGPIGRRGFSIPIIK